MDITGNPSGQGFSPAAVCPLCGGPNECAMAADPSASECWCEFEEFPPDLLAQLPEHTQKKFCICRTCLISYLKSRSHQDNSNEG